MGKSMPQLHRLIVPASFPRYPPAVYRVHVKPDIQHDISMLSEELVFLYDPHDPHESPQQ